MGHGIENFGFVYLVADKGTRRNGDKGRFPRPFFPLVSPSPGLLVTYFVAVFSIEWQRA
jgi:hypothetical protein